MGVEPMHVLSRTFRTSLHALQRNKMRSALTILGIVIGIAAVIAMMEIGKGSARSIERTIRRMGADNIIVQSGPATSGGVTLGTATPTLTTQDADYIVRECP